MTYSPPVGNAVNFVFVNAGYAPPAGNHVNFVFGGSTPPPPPSPALPTGIVQALKPDDDWFPAPMREFEAVVATVATLLPYERFAMPAFDDDWFPAPQREAAPVAQPSPFERAFAFEAEGLWFPALMNRRIFAPVTAPVLIRPYVQIFTA